MAPTHGDRRCRPRTRGDVLDGLEPVDDSHGNLIAAMDGTQNSIHSQPLTEPVIAPG
ncbi:uncharacterized protein (DUF2235 family) [Kitasatospora paracochleata]|uniref:Uncharacterized protein (DUF2235 family) n=1 Tax=Kitasatospora paracochleata TaxID=58354 RepID=A0ABT1J9U8_9ACTN|nr:uncharacterized protein (DUF2235 family) [Kitasatospora paracochleata]